MHFEQEVAGADERGSGSSIATGSQVCNLATFERLDPETQGGTEAVGFLEVVHGGFEAVARREGVGTVMRVKSRILLHLQKAEGWSVVTESGREVSDVRE